MKVLFISRAYPPIVGGIEKENFEIYRALSKYLTVHLVANRKGKHVLPFFIVFAILKAMTTHRDHDIVLLGDGVAAVIGRVLKVFSRKPCVCIVHGLDLSYKNAIYQSLWVRRFLCSTDRLVAIGNEAIEQGVKRGIPRSKFTFVPDGVDVRVPVKKYTRDDLKALAGRDIRGPALLTLGRLVRRKGVVWFIENVMVNLDDDVSYLIAGAGPEEGRLLDAVERLRLNQRVIHLGSVSEQEKEMLYSVADVFVQPNITVDGDIEGFGLVVLEAASYGLPVVASNMQGLRDAIHDQKNGILIDEGDAEAYKRQIEGLLGNDQDRRRFGEKAKAYVEEHFSWDSTARNYVDIFRELAGP